MPSSIAALIAAVSCASLHRDASCVGAVPNRCCIVYITSISSSPSNSGSPVDNSLSKQAHAQISTCIVMLSIRQHCVICM
jgi:hypothetical protein